MIFLSEKPKNYLQKFQEFDPDEYEATIRLQVPFELLDDEEKVKEWVRVKINQRLRYLYLKAIEEMSQNAK